MWQGHFDKLFIGGEWTDPESSGTYGVISPSTEKEIARVPVGTAADVDRAVAAARKAFDRGPWPRSTLDERITVLRNLSALLAEHQEDFASLVTAEMGCPIALSEKMQAIGPRMLLDSFLDIAPNYPWRSIRTSATGNGLVTREPVGVVAAIVPWNAPLLITMIKLAPALLAGATVVLKPTLATPLDSYLLAELIAASGVPEGVVNVVPADRDVSEYLVRHPGVDKVSFTGSTAAGRRIAALCGEDLRRVTLELGGKSAAVVLDDADLDVVIPSIRALSLRNTGQVCSNKTRIVVARSRRKELHDALVGMVESMPIGDPFDRATEVGPVANEAQLRRVERYVNDARNSGLNLLVGGGRPDGLAHGFFVEPTIFADVDPTAPIAQEEVFGPVLTVHTFDDESEAIEIANNSQYGLNGSVFAADPEHALEVASRIRTGTVEVNGAGAGFASPMGGFKSSGIGREAGLEGFDAYVEIKSYGLPADLYSSLTGKG